MKKFLTGLLGLMVLSTNLTYKSANENIKQPYYRQQVKREVKNTEVSNINKKTKFQSLLMTERLKNLKNNRFVSDSSKVLSWLSYKFLVFSGLYIIYRGNKKIVHKGLEVVVKNVMPIMVFHFLKVNMTLLRYDFQQQSSPSVDRLRTLNEQLHNLTQRLERILPNFRPREREILQHELELLQQAAAAAQPQPAVAQPPQVHEVQEEQEIHEEQEES